MSDSPCVETAKGPVRGKVVGSSKFPNSKQVYKFSSIPFAKPPVGELRFERPQDVEPWSEVLDGTRAIPSPMQDGSVLQFIKNFVVMEDIPAEDTNKFSEDCLYLNVYTNNISPSANMPVLLWLYGGGFIMGSAIGTNGQTICSMHDVVVVVPNYRVNVFGFFTAGKDTKWKGNMGFFDQLKAMEWTKKNIKSFGGNPENVTIFGESAGGASVGYHMLSPLSRGYFHRAISHSGAATMQAMSKPDYTEFRNLFLEQLKITATEADDMVAELKKKTAKELLDANIEAAKKLPVSQFTIHIDGEFVPEDPLQLIKKSDVSAPVPYIVGCNNTEGCGLMSSAMPEFSTGTSEESVLGIVKMVLNEKPYTEEKKTEVAKLIMETYGTKYSDDDKMKWSKIGGELMGDLWFVIPAILQARTHADSGHPCYVYCMTQTPAHCHSKEYNSSDTMIMKSDICECDHGDDVMFTWGFPYSTAKMTAEIKFTDDEHTMTEQWMNYIVNFASTGNPNIGKQVPGEWPLYTSSDKRHLTAQVPFGSDRNLIEDHFNFIIDTLYGDN